MSFTRILLVCLFVSKSFSIDTWNFRYNVYEKSDAFTNLTVESTVQNKNGNIWFATSRGIISFDGTKWTRIKIIVDGEDFSNLSFKYLSKSKGTIATVISSKDSLNYLFIINSDGRWLKHEVSIHPDIRIRNFEYRILESSQYFIIHTIQNGVMIYNQDKWFTILRDKNINGINVVDKRLFVSTTAGLFSYDLISKDLTFFRNSYNMSILGTCKRGKEILVFSNGWMGTVINDSITIINNTIFQNVTTYKYLNFEILQFISDCYGGVYFGTRASLFYLAPGADYFKKINNIYELSVNGISFIYKDVEENIWVSTPRGIFKVQRSTFRNYSKVNGLLEDEVTSIYIDHKIILGHNSGYTRIAGNIVKPVTLLNPISLLQGNSRMMDIQEFNHKIYGAISHLGVINLSNDSLRIYRMAKGDVAFGLEIYKNLLLVNSNEGIDRLENNHIQPWIKNSMLQIGARDMISTNDGKLYVAGLMGGISEYYNDNWSFYDNDDTRRMRLFKLFDSGDAIFAGSEFGLYKFDKSSKLLNKQTSPFSIDRPVYMIEKDLKGRLWFGTDNGVFKWDGENLRYYTTSHGLIGPETNRNASAIDSLGRIWIGTNKGVSVYMEEWDWDPSPPPFVYLNYIESTNDSLNPNEPIELEYNNNDLTFHYVANSFIDEDKIRVVTKLEGYENDWQPEISSHTQSIRYTNLPPGKYSFQFKARGVDDVYSDIVSSAVITITLPFWRKWWFYTLVAIGFTGIGYTIRSYYQKRKYTSELESEVDIRTRHLHQSRENYRMLIETAIDPIIEFNANGIILSCNQATYTTFSYTEEELRDAKMALLFSQDEAFRSFWHGIEAYIIKESITVVGKSVGATGITKNNRFLNILISTSVRVRDDIIVFTAFIKDISEQKKLEKELLNNLNILEIQREDLKRLSMEAIRAQETERKRISQDLHDQIGQSLSALNFSLEVIRDQQATGVNVEEMIKECQTLVSDTSEDIHRFTFQLRPSILDDLGLKDAIKEHLVHITKTVNLKYEITGSFDENRIPRDYTIIIYRIFQESFTNILKHAGASKVTLIFHQSNSLFRMIIHDDGKGFTNMVDPRPNQHGGFGILGMEERARYVGGSLLIESNSQKGTSVILDLPI